MSNSPSSSQSDDAPPPLRYPELPPELAKPRLSTMLKLIGPGAILASITIGSGETVFASRSGAVFGFSILWLFAGGDSKAANKLMPLVHTELRELAA